MQARYALEAERTIWTMLGEQMVADPVLSPERTFDRERWDALFDEYLEKANPTIWFAVSETGWIVGFAMASLVPHLACPSTVAQLNFLYTQPKARNRLAGGRAATLLMREFEAWADRVGAYESTVGVTTPYRAESTAKLYEAFGYRPLVSMSKRRAA